MRCHPKCRDLTMISNVSNCEVVCFVGKLVRSFEPCSVVAIIRFEIDPIKQKNYLVGQILHKIRFHESFMSIHYRKNFLSDLTLNPDSIVPHLRSYFLSIGM